MRLRFVTGLVGLLAVATAAVAPAQTARKLGELELRLAGLEATVDPASPTVPKNVPSGVRVLVRAAGSELSAAEVATFLGSPFVLEAELSGPGLRETLTIPQRGPDDPPPADPLLLPLPPLSVAGDYTLGNLRLVAGSRSLLDAQPRRVPVKVIDRILVTSVKTRPLSLDEIRQKGIVLDSDDYLGFDFSLGLKLESKVVSLSFPVVFDRQGVPVPQPQGLQPEDPRRQQPTAETRAAAQLASITPILLTAIPEGGGGASRAPLTFGDGQPIRIPSVLVIPGNAGFLKQFFSAQLFVANGAPVGAPLTLRDVTGTIRLPLGADLTPGGPDLPGSDDPLALPDTVRGPQPKTLPVRGVGPDGEPGTGDDPSSFAPAEQGQAEFLIRGEKEGFHSIDIDVGAVLDGLPTGPVRIAGKATGGVLVRNPYFDVSFTLPSTVRRGEAFKVFMTVTNTGQASANDLTVSLDALALAGARPVGPASQHIPTLRAGEARVLAFELRSETAGAVVASYLGFDADPGASVTGSLRFKLGVGERGVPLSPDTLALPAGVEELPPALVDAAMRVLGQAWSLAGAPAASLPRGVIRIGRPAVQQKALALAEAGLRVKLGQAGTGAIRDLIVDFYGGAELDGGFDQLLRQTEAGRDLAQALGTELAGAVEAAGGAAEYERELAGLLASGPDFLSFAASGATPVGVSLVDGLGRQLLGHRSAEGIGTAEIPAGVVVPLGPAESAALLGFVARPEASPYTLEVDGPALLSFTLPGGEGVFLRSEAAVAGRGRLVVDLGRPEALALEEDADGDGVFETRRGLPFEAIRSNGPELVSATVIGPETFGSASEFGTSIALLFDRPVEAAGAGNPASYTVPGNAVVAAKRQLSGRLVFGSLAFPEGPHVETSITVGGVPDERGVASGAATLPLLSRLDRTRGGGVLVGRVVSADGEAVGGGTIYYSNSSEAQCGASGGGAATTVSALPLDEEARYEVRYVARNSCGLPFEIAHLDPRSGSLRKVSGVVRRDGERLVMDLALIGRGSVAGTVRDLAGQPAPGARVVVLSQTDPNTGRTTDTDGDGRYAVSDVAVGPVTVRAGKGIGLGTSSGRIARAGTTATVDVTLDTGGAVRVSGRVYRVEGAAAVPVAGELLSYSAASDVTGYAYTDLEGRYLFEDMPVGAFVIRGRSGSATGVGVAGQELRDVNIVVESRPETEYGEVRGVVVLPDGTPAPGVIVAKDVSSLIVEGGVLTGPDGSFRVSGLEVGRNLGLHAITRDRRRTGSASFRIDPGTRVADGVSITLSAIGAAELTVFDPGGSPLPGVEVALISTGGPLTLGACASPCGCRAALTGPDGKVRYEELPLGRWALQAIRRGAGFIDVARTSVSVTREGTTAVGAIRFQGTGTVSGVVRYPEGAIGGGGEIALTSRVFRNDGFTTCGLVGDISHRATIDPGTGRFRFTGVNLGPVSLSATNPFFPTPAGGSGTLTLDGQELELELRFVDTLAGELAGVVSLPDGVTPAGGGVEVSADGQTLRGVTVRTNAEGRYAFPALLPAGGYTLTARDPMTGGVARASVFLRAGRPASLDLRLKSRGEVRVRVVDGFDQPVRRAFVRLSESEYPNRSYEAALEPAGAGVAVFDRVFEGPFSVEAFSEAGGGRASSVRPRVFGSVVEVKVRMSLSGRVRGRFLYPDGTPVPFGLVTLKSGGRTLGQITTPGAGDVGAFSFDYVPAGPLRLEAQDPLTNRAGFAVGTLVGEGQELELDVVAQGLGSVEGVVRANDTPQPGARVEIVSGAFRATTLADAAGRYAVQGIPEGRIDATASLDRGLLAGTASATLTGDGTRLTLDVALRDSGALAGRVVLADGLTPGPPALVSLSVGGAGGGSQTAATGPDGRFRFDLVPSGRATLLVDALGSIDRAKATVEVPAGETVDVSIPLNGVGSIRGRAVDGRTGGPVAGEVTVSGTWAFGWSVALIVGADGGFRLPEALAGPFTVHLRAGAGALILHGTASGTLGAGDAAEIEVRTEDSGSVQGVVRRADGVTPVVGAEVTLDLDGGRGSVSLQADNGGRFSAAGVPVGLFGVRVFDPVTTGRAILTGRAVRANGDRADLGEILLDERGPTLRVLDPAEGLTRARFGGPLVIQLDDAADLDPASIAVTYPSGASVSGLVVSGSRATGVLSVSDLRVGVNVLRVRAADRTGNLGEADVRFTLSGGALRGRVGTPDGRDAVGVPVTIPGLEPATTGPGGFFGRTGVKPGTYTVTATDPATGLSASGTATLYDGDAEVAEVEITLPAHGSIAGIVEHADGAPAFGVRVQLGRTGPWVTTSSAGRFLFERVPLGTHEVYATDEATGDRGRATVVTAAHGHEAAATIRLNGVGSLEVRVETATGTSVAGATVLVSSEAGDGYAAPTDASGLAHFSSVSAGLLTVRATDPRRGLTGEARGTVAPGGSGSITVTLAAAGRVEGRVLQFDGSPAPFARVTLSGTRSASSEADAAGAFAFEDVPAGSFGLVAHAASGGDGGTAAGVLLAEGQTVTSEIRLTGVGVVRATVRDADGTLVPGALVEVSWDGPFPGSRRAVTAATGFVSLDDVLAGEVSLRATNAVLGTSASATATLRAGGFVEVALDLEGLALVRGHVYEPDGVTPAEGVVVGIGIGNPARFATTGPDGAYEFDRLRLLPFGLFADRSPWRRAVSSVVLRRHAEVAVRDLVLVGVGTVTGLVSDPGGAAVPGQAVSLTSSAPVFGGTRSARTDFDGRFAFPEVPLGPIAVSATRGTERAEASGEISVHGQAIRADLRLVASAVTLPTQLADGNGATFRFEADGRFYSGDLCRLYDGGGRLILERDETSVEFAGSGNTVSSEEGKRELVIQQTGLFGLSITRKAFVPRTGYFLRYLELLRNDASHSVTVDVALETDSHWSLALTSTSSGDPALEASDRWAAFEGGRSGGCEFPPTGIGFAGAGGVAPSALSLGYHSAGSRLVARWSSVTIPPGSTAGFLHVLTQQSEPWRAEASAERLTSLPPELLEGLTPDEASAIVNFVVPSDLNSALPALPPLDGEVVGRVLSGDGETPVPEATVELRSRSPHFGRTLTTVSAADGTFRFLAAPAASPPLLLPRADFDLASTYGAFGVAHRATAGGGFAPGARRSDRDLGFAGVGVVEGRVLRSDGSVVAGSVVRIDGPQGSQMASATPERFRFPVVAPGTYTIAATHPLGGGLEARRPVSVAAGRKAVQDVTFAPFGGLRGTVRTAGGVPAASPLELTGAGGFARSGRSSGSYLFSDVPPGIYTVSARDDRNFASVRQAVAIAAGSPAVLDLVLPPLGQVQALVALRGAPLPGARVLWQSDARGPDFNTGCTTDALGRCTVLGAAGPTLRIRAEYPGHAQSYGEVAVALTTEGQTATAAVAVPGLGVASGVVRSRDGVALGGRTVGLYRDGVRLAQTTAAGDGTFSLTEVPVGPFRVRSSERPAGDPDPREFHGERAGSLSEHGDRLTLDGLAPWGALVSPGERQLWQAVLTVPGVPLSARIEGAAYGPHAALALPVVDVFGPRGARLAASAPSGPAADLAFTPLEPGRHVFLVSAGGDGIGGYRLGSACCARPPFYEVYDGATLSGRAVGDGERSGIPDLALRVLRDGQVSATTATSRDGGYLLPLLVPGAYSVEALDREGVVLAEALTVVGADVESARADLVVPERGRVTLRAHRGPQRVADLLVTLISDHVAARDEDRVRARTTSADGTLATALPTGLVTARATSPFDGLSHEVSGTLGKDATLELDLAFPVDAVGTVRGVVSGRFGQAPIAGATVEIGGVGSVATDAAGGYRFDGLATGSYTAIARFGSKSVTRPILIAEGAVVEDFELPVDMLRGRVQEPDGRGAVAAVSVCGASCTHTTSGEDGSYALYDPAPGDAVSLVVTATLTDGSGLRASLSTPPPRGAVTLHLVLPPSGTIEGSVREATGEAVPGAWIVVHNPVEQRSVRTGRADDSGRYRFTHVLLQPLLVGAYGDEGIPGGARGELTAASQVLTLDVTLAPTGTASVLLLDEAGRPLAGESAYLESLEADPFVYSSYHYLSISRRAGPDGRFTAPVPAGPFRVVQPGPNPAAFEGTMPPGGLVEAGLERASHVWLPHELSGPTGAYAGIGAYRPCASLPCGAFARAVPEDSGYALDLAALEPAGRSLETLLESVRGVRYRRSFYVPASGAFARSLTLLTNTTPVPLTLPIVTEVSGAGPGAAVLTSSGDPDPDPADAFVVVRPSDPASPDFALVVGSLLQPAWGLDASLRSRQEVVLLPGQTRAFLAFSLARARGDEGSLLAQARSLADLSAPDALAGLDEEQRSLIANFAILGVTSVIDGTARNPRGEGVPGLAVRLTSPSGAVQARTTDAQGGYRAPAPETGTYAIEARDTAGVPVALGSAYVSAPGELVTSDLEVPLHALATVQVSREGTPLAAVAVSFESDNPTALGQDRARSGLTDASGRAVVSLPVGNVTARVLDPESGRVFAASGVLGESPPLSLTIALPGPIYAALEGPTGGGRGLVEGWGWAFRCEGSIASYALYVDGAPVAASFATGEPRADVRDAWGFACPSLGLATGYRFTLDTSALGLGPHSLHVRLTDDLGRSAETNVAAFEVWPFAASRLETPTDPVSGELVRGGGFAFVCGDPIASYSLLVDGVELAGPAFTQTSRAEIAASYRTECPSLGDVVGFEYEVPADRIPAGSHVAQVRFTDARGVSRTTNTLELVVDPALRHSGTLLVSYHAAGPAASRRVRVEALEARPGPDPWRTSVETNADSIDAATGVTVPGPPVSVRVPVGPYRVVFDEDWPPAAIEGTLLEGETRAAELIEGSHAFRRDGPPGPFVEPSVTGVEPFPEVVKLEQSGRAMRSLLVAGSGVRLRRQEYEALSGALRRTLTLVTNPGDAEAVVDVVEGLRLGYGSWRVAATSSGDANLDTADAYAIAVAGEESAGLVLGNALSPTQASFLNGFGDRPSLLRVVHRLRIPPRQTRGLLAFAIAGEDTASAVALASALADLTGPAAPPEALEGLSGEERAAVVNFSLPLVGGAHGSVTGIVVDAGGRPVPGAEISIGDGRWRGTADTDGRFSVTGVAAGDQTIVAADPLTQRPGVARARVPDSGSVDVLITLLRDSAVGTVHVRGVLEGSGAPAEGAMAFLTHPDFPGWASRRTLNAVGEADFVSIPAGRVFLTSGAPPMAGWAFADLPRTGSVAVDLRIGERAAFPIDLTGADGISYFAHAGSVLQASGGRPDWDCSPFCSGYSSVSLGDDGHAHEPPPFARVIAGAEGRQVVVGPQAFGTLRATRKTFVPAGGRFARILDVLENASAAPVTAAIYLEQAHRSAALWQVATSSASPAEVLDTDDLYAVVSSEDPGSPAMAIVIAGPGGLGRDLTERIADGVEWTWLVTGQTLTVPAGGIVAVMRFVVQRPHGEIRQAAEQAEALVSLVDPDALAGLTAGERAAVANFVVPRP